MYLAKVIKEESYNLGECLILRRDVALVTPQTFKDVCFIGIDPGQVNMGLSVILGPKTQTFQIKLPSTVDTVERVILTLDTVEGLLSGFDLNQANTRKGTACVEQAAYAAEWGQVALAENRTSAIIGLLRKGIGTVLVVPPGSIRKEVFGSSKQRAEETWPDIGKDAASSLCCALYAYRIHERAKNAG